MSGMEVLFLVLAVLTVTILYLKISNAMKKRGNLKKLKDEGFITSYIMKGSNTNVAIDTTNQIIAFVFAGGIKKISFEQIIGWEHTFVQKMRTSGDISERIFESNAIEFTVRDLKNPLIKIAISNYEFGKEWSARFTVLFNG